MTTPPITAGIPENLLAMNFARPEGVSILDAMTHQHCKDTGKKSYLPASTAAKIEGKPAQVSGNPPHGVAERFQRFLATGQHSTIYQQRDSRALLDHARNMILSMSGKSAAAVSTSSKPSPAPTTPAASKPASKFEHYRKLQSTDPVAASAFWDANEKDIIAGK